MGVQNCTVHCVGAGVALKENSPRRRHTHSAAHFMRSCAPMHISDPRLQSANTTHRFEV